jgi:heme A synthase
VAAIWASTILRRTRPGALMAATTTAATAALSPPVAASLPSAITGVLHSVAGMTALQVTLGIATLLTYVPTDLGSAHQAGALTLFTLVLGLVHTLRPAQPSELSRAVGRVAGPAAAAATLGIAFAVTQTQ